MEQIYIAINSPPSSAGMSLRGKWVRGEITDNFLNWNSADSHGNRVGNRLHLKQT
jgi:hypothetical protein